ncbi:MAG TPA: AAA family ATPase [Thermodesulfobacteriota bacterium]|nr:AAA family ATPase [Thermodesulfobacteriota bacterium]
MITIALYSMKGGVGKTAAAVNLAYLAAAEAYRTLICDLDPQGASSYYFRIKASRSFNSSKFVKGGRNIDENIKGTDYPNLDLLPSKLSYRNLDIAFDEMRHSKFRLKRIFKGVEHEYDYLFLDCPPGISLVSENIFNAADFIFIPLIPTTLSVMTYEKLLDFFRKQELDERKLYAFFSMVETRKTLHNEIMENLEPGAKNILKAHIPYRSDIERMGVYREPVTAYLPNSESAKFYAELWEEMKGIVGKGRLDFNISNDMNNEIERKFLVNEIPEDLYKYPSSHISQGYLEVTDDETEVRIRGKEGRFFKTVKSGQGLERKEIETVIGDEAYNELWPKTAGRRIEKRRYEVPYEAHVIELDIYLGDLAGLIVAEVEFESVEESTRFMPPQWFGREVTDDSRYKNRNLALHGRPDK